MLRGKRNNGDAAAIERHAAPDLGIYGGSAFSQNSVSPTSHLLGKSE